MESGPNLTERGHSVFDEITADGVPFPFEALLEKLDQRIGCAPHGCVDAVLIPLGRSLQRMAAAPEFFQSPRVVVAVTGEGKGPVFARQRLYIGYQPRSALLEVISYNDEAGRFEFQLVHEYREGGTPAVVMAERSVCVACHQNQAPIFSRPLWSETNANPAIADALRNAAGPLRTHRWPGVDLGRGVDAPNAIDEATDASNLLAVTQRLWRDACDAKCRPAAVRAALSYRLSGGRRFEPLEDFTRQFESAFPSGLAIPNPDLPNRDPLARSDADALTRADVVASLEALQPRPPIETWNTDDPYLERRFILGLAGMFAEADLPRLRANEDEAYRQIDAHHWDEDTIGRGSMLRAIARPTDERRLTRIDHERARVAVARSEQPAGSDEAGPPVAELPPSAAEFLATCGACHATVERSPPNFLAGDATQVLAKLRQCAPRIYVRLANWQRPREQWTKVPMPPPRAGAAGHPAVQMQADAVVATLQRTAVEWLRAEAGDAAPERLLEQEYEHLPTCLPSAD